jgi:predicted ATPase/DNA-binding SARP family transcriptional activator
VRIAILGPLAVTVAGQPVPIGGARLRALLIRLAVDAGRPVRTDALIDAVWGDDPPVGAANALQTLVSRLRRLLPAERLTGDPTGYRVSAEVDIDDFDRLVRAGRDATDATAARAYLAEALALWRGPALVDVAEFDFARATAARLDEAHIAVAEDWLAARATIEPAGDLVGEIEELAAAHPLRERPHALLMTALASAGRQAEAIRGYEQLRDRLSEELGIDPSPEVAAAYTAMLRGERAGNVRAALTSFVGRDAELARLLAMVRAHRLVTLVGPGGAGKTRLATEAARRLGAEFAGGVWIIELAPVREPDGVAGALAEALQLREVRFLDLSSAGNPFDRVLDALGSKDLLLVLDNCEHLIDASARIADALLGACPGVRIVTTSREPLAINGEALCPLGPLATPQIDVGPSAAAEVASVRLFVDRASAVKPGFTLTDANTGAVAEICRRLDGMPLAIELACARLRSMPVEAIAARLDDRFRLLTGGSRTALPRHQTLQAVVEWTWDLLSDDERFLATRFSVFLDGATVDTITAICGAGSVEALGGLVDKSFVLLGDDGRYRMLETIRSYAAERLAEGGQAAVARTDHASFFATTAELADRHMRDAQQIRWLKWMSDERDNLAGALRWAIDTGNAALAVRLSGALGWFWLLCDYHVEASNWLAQSLALPGDVPDSARALALAHYGINMMATGDAAKVDDALTQARSLGCDHPVVALSEVMGGMFGDDFSRAAAALPRLRAHPDPWVRAMGTMVGAILNIYTGVADEAEAGLIDALGQFEAIGDQWARSTLTSVLGEIRGLRGDREGAIAAFRLAATLAEELSVPEVTAGVLMSLCLHEARIGDLGGARRDLDRAMRQASRGVSPQMSAQLGGAEAEIARRGGDLLTARARYREVIASVGSARGIAREIVASLLSGLALTEIGLGNVDVGSTLAGEIFDLAVAIRGRIGLSVCSTVCMAAADATSRPADAAYLLGIGDAVRGVVDAGTPEVQEVAASARALLGDAEFEAHYERGRKLDFGAAVDVLRVTVGR